MFYDLDGFVTSCGGIMVTFENFSKIKPNLRSTRVPQRIVESLKLQIP